MGGGRGGDSQETALTGARWNAGAFADKSPSQALAAAASAVKELELTFFGGQPMYLAHESPQASLAIPVRGVPSSQFDSARVAEILASASQPYALAEVRVVRDYEAYYLDRHHRGPCRCSWCA